MSDKSEKLIDLCNAAELNYRSYSGRGMYGAKCLAITTARPESAILTLFGVALELEWTREELQDLCDILSEYCTDSMGLQVVIYWPELTLTEDECRAMSEDE